MTLVRYGQAAMIAAILAVAGNAVSAQESWPQGGFSTGYAPPAKAIPYKEAGIYNLLSEVLSAIPCEIKVKCCVSKECCAAGACCKNGQCCKAGECASNGKTCDAKCSCCKDSKCSCCKGGDCCCDNNGKCSCNKDKTSSKKTANGCPFLSKLAKRTAIIMVMPASMPLPACCMEAMGMMPHPPMMPPMPMPPGPHVFMPPMMPPMPPIPPTPSMAIGAPMMPPMTAVCAPPAYAPPCPDVNTSWAVGVCTVPCSTSKPETATKACIIGAASSGHDEVAMSIGGEETSIRCKKMTVKIGDHEIRVSRFNDRVRVRGEQLKATADCVRTDGKDRIILEGDVVLSYEKEGSSVAKVLKADHIELNLSNGTVNMQRVKSLDVTPVIHESK